MALDGADAHGVVIVGGGICGLATALALHRKGIRSTVLERSETLRSTGAAIGMWTNAWRALDQLQVAPELRNKSVQLTEIIDQWTWKTNTTRAPVSEGVEFRCLVRKDLVETLAAELPPGSIRFGCHVDGISLDPVTSYPVLSASDGSTISAKMLIGCDGSNSAVAKFLGLKDPTPFPLWVIRGFTSYPDGHSIGNNFLRNRAKTSFFGRITISDTLVHFYIRIPIASIDPSIKDNHELIKKLAVEKAQEYPREIIELVEQCDVESLSLTQVRHRVPWHMLNKGKFQQSTVTVAGDAMHVLSPFLGQGGALAMEDAVVLARHIARAIPGGVFGSGAAAEIAAAEREYIKERWPRVMRLSTQSYLGVASTSSKSIVVKLFYFALILTFFGGLNDYGHTYYDCGLL